MGSTSWTKSEDNVVLKHLKRNPQNLQAAFAEAAEQLDRTATACSVRYYNHLRGENPAISVVTSDGHATLGNIKTLKRKVTNGLNEQDRLAIAAALVKRMSRESKQSLIRILLEI